MIYEKLSLDLPAPRSAIQGSDLVPGTLAPFVAKIMNLYWAFSFKPVTF